jgi:hypothetical protein
MGGERIFIDTDNRWYFRIRGNQISSPYASQALAQAALETFIGDCRRRTEPVDLAKSVDMLRRSGVATVAPDTRPAERNA